jgi:hypothetical protein
MFEKLTFELWCIYFIFSILGWNMRNKKGILWPLSPHSCLVMSTRPLLSRAVTAPRLSVVPNIAWRTLFRDTKLQIRH